MEAVMDRGDKLAAEALFDPAATWPAIQASGKLNRHQLLATQSHHVFPLFSPS